MKVLFITLLVVAAAFGGAVPKSFQIKAEGPRCPFDPEEDFPGRNINQTIGDPQTPEALILHITEKSFHEGVFATGLHNLWYNINVNGMNIEFQAKFPETFCGNGESYEAYGKIDAKPFTAAVLPTGDFEGKGVFDACITDARITGSATLKLNIFTGQVSVSKLAFTEMTFASVKVDLKGMKVNGELVPWDTWSAELKANFDKEWPIHGAGFTERARAAATHALKPYTLEELIDFINRPPAPCP